MTPPNAPTTPAGTSNFSQIWEDKLTGLYFTNILYDGSGSIHWADGMNMCGNLNSGDGTGNWRMPTQKELMQLHINGISKLTVAGGTWADAYIWSSSAVSLSQRSAWFVGLANGTTTYDFRAYTTNGVVCVR